MSLLKNVVESIQVGVQDYDSDDERRGVSAMRNIAAGLFLLFNEAMRTIPAFGQGTPD